ncbi:GNAT family N-acetyltransferase [Anaerobacillus sp. CMMVII]|uniref:GNAT family N-acetyltransferase n=1 Tax=Anaerobacillus sp. CMMVII TaxID=2755588 RepID=UPI0021B81BC3|nr:GNAT family N-acetyltransferase [Anaerobacillus sp. CMMVII]MCT8136895.1 GNAT family N-acetyltransferase [Anaerobacillus sp. CMMVII]
MSHIQYRDLRVEECERVSEIDPSQWIEKVWRNIDGDYQLITINYQEDDWPDGYEKYRDALIDTINCGGIAIGAFAEDGRLVGFVTLNKEFFGGTANYLLLDSMFVSRDYRNLGIGKQLFQLCAAKAREWGADKLYLCAASSEDTIAFYRSVGCVAAAEINQDLFDNDHRDIQLEYVLSED